MSNCKKQESPHFTNQHQDRLTYKTGIYIVALQPTITSELVSPKSAGPPKPGVGGGIGPFLANLEIIPGTCTCKIEKTICIYANMFYKRFYENKDINIINPTDIKTLRIIK